MLAVLYFPLHRVRPVHYDINYTIISIIISKFLFPQIPSVTDLDYTLYNLHRHGPSYCKSMSRIAKQPIKAMPMTFSSPLV